MPSRIYWRCVAYAPQWRVRSQPTRLSSCQQDCSPTLVSLPHLRRASLVPDSPLKDTRRRKAVVNGEVGDSATDWELLTVVSYEELSVAPRACSCLATSRSASALAQTDVEMQRGSYHLALPGRAAAAGSLSPSPHIWLRSNIATCPAIPGRPYPPARTFGMRQRSAESENSADAAQLRVHTQKCACACGCHTIHLAGELRAHRTRCAYRTRHRWAAAATPDAVTTRACRASQRTRKGQGLQAHVCHFPLCRKRREATPLGSTQHNATSRQVPSRRVSSQIGGIATR